MRIKAVLVTIIIGCISFGLFGCTNSGNNSNSVTNETASPTASVNTNYKYTGLKRGPIQTVEFGGEDFYYSECTSDMPGTYVAILGDEQKASMLDSFIFMEDGSGIFGLADAKGDLVVNKYNHGYFKGVSVSESEYGISIDHWTDEYVDLFGSYLNVKYQITSNANKSGLLFCELIVNGIVYSHCFPVVMVDGYAIGMEEVVSDDVVDVESVIVRPLYFCEAEELYEDDYQIKKDSLSKTKSEIDRIVDIQINRKQSGYLLISNKAIDTIDGKEFIANSFEATLNGKARCFLDDYDYYNSEIRELTPKYIKNMEIQKDNRFFYVPVYQ